MTAASREFPRSMDALQDLFEYLHTFCASAGATGEDVYAVDLIGEELFTNLVKYNHGGHENIIVNLALEDGSLVLSLVDRDVESFDITATPEIDTTRPMSEREPGGLGIHIVKKMTDRLTYHYQDRTSTITAVKRLGE